MVYKIGSYVVSTISAERTYMMVYPISILGIISRMRRLKVMTSKMKSI